MVEACYLRWLALLLLFCLDDPALEGVTGVRGKCSMVPKMKVLLWIIQLEIRNEPQQGMLENIET